MDAFGKMRRQKETLAKFFDCLGDFIERIGKGLDVLPLQWGHEGRAKVFADFTRDDFVLAALLNEFIQGENVVRRFQVWHEQKNAAPCFFSATLKQVKEFVVTTEEFLQREHNTI